MHQFIKFGLSLASVVCLMAGPAWAQDTVSTTSTGRASAVVGEWNPDGGNLTTSLRGTFAGTDSLFGAFTCSLAGTNSYLGETGPPAADTTGVCNPESASIASYGSYSYSRTDCQYDNTGQAFTIALPGTAVACVPFSCFAEPQTTDAGTEFYPLTTGCTYPAFYTLTGMAEDGTWTAESEMVETLTIQSSNYDAARGVLVTRSSSTFTGMGTATLTIPEEDLPTRNGHVDYCRDYGPCSVGQGDCDRNSECESGLECRRNVGATYGFPANYDVCEAASSGGQIGHVDYCRDSGPCSAGEGDCDNTSECESGLECSRNVGADYGLPADYDVCEAASSGGQIGHVDYCRDSGPCSAGEGDCDNTSECESGLECSRNVGANYGLPANYDVCEAASSGEQIGHVDYCRDYGPCSAGEGDCDNTSECESGLECSRNVGANYGFSANYDVCEAASSAGQNGDVDYCRDYGPCSVGQGDCDNTSECESGLECRRNVGAAYGFPANYDVCAAAEGQNGDVDYCRDHGPCSVGEGDCDNTSECESGLECSRNVGATYGFPADYDVCE